MFVALVFQTWALNFQPASTSRPLSSWRTTDPFMKELARRDSVCVIGASGNVGKLVALRLAEQFQVRGIVRSASAVRSFLPASVELCEVDVVRDGETALEAALKDVNAVIVCTGTTAFPTKAWCKSRDDNSIAGAVISALSEAKFDKDLAISVLDKAGYNTPKNVDELGTLRILDAWAKAAGGARKRFVLMSSIGVDRRTQMPFPILNACGVLDAKAAGERALKQAAAAGGFSYTIVRPGQLFGGPYTNNYYLGTLFQLDKDAATQVTALIESGCSIALHHCSISGSPASLPSPAQDVELARGDTLVGDTLRSTLAEVIAQVLETGAAHNIDFSVVNQKGTPPSIEQLQSRLAKL